MTLVERLAKLTARLEMEGRYTDARITYAALETICRHEGLDEPEVPTENSCGQAEKM